MKNLIFTLFCIAFLSIPSIIFGNDSVKETIVSKKFCNLTSIIYESKTVTLVNPYSYVCILHADGCFHLYRIHEYSNGVFMFTKVKKMDYENYIGNTMNCAFKLQELDAMC